MTHVSNAGRLPKFFDPLLKTGAALLLLLPFLPIQLYYGEIPDGKGLFTPYQWLLGLLILGLPAVLLGQAAEAPAARMMQTIGRMFFGVSRGVFILGCLTLLFALLTLISARVFQFRPLLVDDVIQLFQAKIFAAGLWKAPLPRLPQFFLTQHMIMDASGWYSQYPPGHSALLALGVKCGAAWLVPIILSTATAYLLFRFTEEAYDQRTARLALAALLVSPFFLFMGASFMNHVSALCLISAALLALCRFEHSGRPSDLLCTGLSLGIAFLSRPLCAITAGIVFALWLVPDIYKRKEYFAAVLGALGFGVFALLFLLFNFRTTGDPFLPGYIKLWGESHGMGFHVSPWGEIHTPAAGLAKQAINLSMLNEYLFESAAPSCLFVGLLFLLPGEKKRWDGRLLGLLFAFPAMYFFYWHRDSYLGPRFVYVSLLGAVPLTIRGIQTAFEFLGRPGSRAAGFNASPAFGFFVALFFSYTALLGFPGQFKIYESGLSSMKIDIRAEAKKAGIESGLIFVPVSWGSRILSDLRARGISASAAEKAYRNVDHCLMFQLIKRARRTNMPAGEIENELFELRKFPVKKFPGANGDKTLRLRPDIRPADECLAEIQYDRKGYGLFLPHLLADDPDLNGPFVLATDLRFENYRLIESYPQLQPYIYRNGIFTPIER